jgi:hypothetical protein
MEELPSKKRGMVEWTFGLVKIERTWTTCTGSPHNMQVDHGGETV